MGRNAFSRAAFRGASETFVPRSGPATRAAEQRARATGKLDPLVDPAEYGVIRQSRVRFEERADGLLELTFGTSMTVECRVDTTGSMGGNVDVAIKVLPDTYELGSGVLPGYDLHMAIGIFGDVVDNFVLCRPQFEMEAHKLVQQLTLMVPERAGGDAPEDPHYGLFGGAYLVASFSNAIGLKGYDFTVSDAPARDSLSERQLVRIFGKDVFDKVAINGFQIDRNDLPSTKEVVQDLQNRAHGFFLQVGESAHTSRFWTNVFGEDRVVVLPSVKLLPYVQAVIIGLTEGTLSLDEVADFLSTNNVDAHDAKRILRSVANIPIGAQVPLRQAIIDGGHEIPKAGDLYRVKPDVLAKTNLWPIDPSELGDVVSVVSTDSGVEEPTWL